MKQIKTVMEHDAGRFDTKVNEALTEGWRLVKRYPFYDGYVAELEMEVITEAERTCENCRHWDKGAQAEPCCHCSTDADKWEEFQL